MSASGGKITGILFYALCVNVILAIIYSTLGVAPATVSTDFEFLDPDQIIDTWNFGGTGTIIGDIGSGLKFIKNIFGVFVRGIFPLARSLGLPSVMATPLEWLWYICWIAYIIEIIFGRRLLP